MEEKQHARRRKREALISLYEESYSKIAQFICVRVGNHHDAEDLASETFVKAIRALDSYQERGLRMEAWLFKIARNLVIDHLRKTGNRHLVPLDEAAVTDSGNPETTVEMDMQADKIRQAMEYLTPIQKEVIYLRFFIGLSALECSAIIGKTPGTVRVMQCSAIKSLRNVMGRGDRDE